MDTVPKVITIFGSSSPLPGSGDYEAARLVGNLLAKAGYTIQTGGYAGVMAGASQGASEAGGHVIGVTCSGIERFRPGPANEWVVKEIKCETLRERVIYLVEHCDGAIVMPGGIGTLSEFALMWSLVQVGELSARPIVVVGGLWQRTLAAFMDANYIRDAHKELVTIARTANEAVRKMVEQLEKRRNL